MTRERARERRALQALVAIAGIVPVGAGLFGVLAGTGMVDVVGTISADSHYRYLSGLLLGIGLAFWHAIPHIERYAARFRLLTAIVFIGGLARLLGLLLQGVPDAPMLFGLCMELFVTPALCVWQNRLAGQFSSGSSAVRPSR